MIAVSIYEPYSLFFSIPLFAIILFINQNYLKVNAKLKFKQQEEEYDLHLLYNLSAVSFDKIKRLMSQPVSDRIMSKFHAIASRKCLYDCNEGWAISGARILGEIMIVLYILGFGLISLSQYENDPDDLALFGLGLGLMANLAGNLRFTLKILKNMNEQLLSLSKLIQIVKQN